MILEIHPLCSVQHCDWVVKI